jgi:hypothetical protein
MSECALRGHGNDFLVCIKDEFLDWQSWFYVSWRTLKMTDASKTLRRVFL